MKNNKMLGETGIDKELCNLYGEITDEVVMFWTDYISKFYSDCYGVKESKFGINYNALEVYTKMIVNILVDCKKPNKWHCETKSFIKFQWHSPSYQYNILFGFFVEVLKNDLKDPLFKEILLRKKALEFRKYIVSRIWTLPFDDETVFFEDGILDEDYTNYFLEKDEYWRHGNLKKLEKIQEMLIKKLLKKT